MYVRLQDRIRRMHILVWREGREREERYEALCIVSFVVIDVIDVIDVIEKRCFFVYGCSLFCFFLRRKKKRAGDF